MTPVLSQIKLKRMEFLQNVLEKYTKTEPILSEKEIATIIVMEFGDISKLLKEIKKEVKIEKL